MRQVQRINDLNRRLTDLLRDKDSLLQQKEFRITEVNQRVQNSLQLVSSFLSVQARQSEDGDLQAALGEARRRLTAVALVHRRLYLGNQVEFLDAARYIEELCAETFSFMGEEWKRNLLLTLTPMQISTDRAVPLGFVLNELLINADKYAYAGSAGPIEVSLTQGRTHFILVVADKGGGKVGPKPGFGSRIMTGFVGQSAGAMTYGDSRPGLRVEVSVPILKH
ncbi:sensor histidine kinase [Acidisphaera sp. L21]|uniref:sensor histidine kinase n=1 Tax=Acidisphaera sp. L21 TaxID=1641851 RepID=UPI00131C580A|nr:sensor histidine kinase [Acidisphaera sp. L21]